MADDFKNTDLVANIAVVEFMNNLVMGQKVDRQLDEKQVFGSTTGIGGKPGATVKLRRPVEYVTNDGATLVEQDIEEATVTVTLDQRKHVAVGVTSEDLTLRIEDARKIIIAPAMKRLAQTVETAIGAEHFQFNNFVGTPGTTPSTFLDIAAADEVLNDLGVPLDDRHAFWTPGAKNALSNGLKAVFVQPIAKRAIERASFGMYASFDNFLCQSLSSHTVGALGGTPAINGASQDTTYLLSKDTDSQTLNVDTWTASVTDIVLAGEVFTIAGVNSVNRETKEDTGNLATFTVLVDATSNGSGETALSIAPAIIISGPYQTVSAAPADGALLTIKTGAANAVHKQNLAWHRNAITLASAQLDIPTDGATGSRANFKGISIRVVRQYDIASDKTFMRFDILYKVVVQNRGFGCRITS